MKKIYLACPYSHPKKGVRLHRTAQSDEKAAELMEKGYRVFSPLSHSVPISRFCSEENNKSYDFWLTQDFWILDVCDELHILCLEGWLNSKGIQAEINRAMEKGIPTVYHHYINGERAG